MPFELIRFTSKGGIMGYSYTESLEDAHKEAKKALKGGIEGRMKKASYVGIVNQDTQVKRFVELKKGELVSKIVD
jgi:hypothetical protein